MKEIKVLGTGCANCNTTLKLIEEVAAPRDDAAGRGRPAVALGVRAQAHLVAGMKLSDREHTAVIVDFAGNLIADDAIPRRPGPTASSTTTASSPAPACSTAEPST